MTKVITYGTYDLLHYGHIKLLERAKALGDYLIVGVTSDDFDRARGKINVSQSLIERIESVRRTGLADEIIVEEYEGQKIDDIKLYGIDIFTVGSDWEGKFDYLNEYCKVVYLDRTQGVSSSELRSQKREVKLGIIGDSHLIEKYRTESKYVNGLQFTAILTDDEDVFFNQVDAVYVVSGPTSHFENTKKALLRNKHVLCESPLATSESDVLELYKIADEKHLVLLEGIKTAYSIAYSRLINLARSGRIGEIVSIDSTCTSLKSPNFENKNFVQNKWNSLSTWGPSALLPIFDLLGTDYEKAILINRIVNESLNYDDFSKIILIFNGAVSSSTVANGVKAEGELIISGTKGYIYVPAPWWKTDYFEIRYENPLNNRRYFYLLEGEGIRNELVFFVRMIEGIHQVNPISRETSLAIAKIMQLKNTSSIKLSVGNKDHLSQI